MGKVIRQKLLVTLLVMLMTGHNAVWGEGQALITPSDCVTVKYPIGDLGGVDDLRHAPVEINPQQTRVAYIVKSPNLLANRNEMQLYVMDLSDRKAVSATAKLLATGTLMSHVQWLDDGKRVLVLMKEKDDTNQAITMVDVGTGKRRPYIHFDGDITEYSIDRAADVVAFSVKPKIPSISQTRSDRLNDLSLSERDIASGFRIPFEKKSGATTTQHYRSETLYITKRIGADEWTTAQTVNVYIPGSKGLASEVVQPRLSLAPNGKWLLVSYFSEEVPEDWQNSLVLHAYKSVNQPPFLIPTILYDVATGKSSMSLKTPRTTSIPLWADDSKSYVVAASPPVGSEWETDDFAHSKLFWVEPGSGGVEKITDQVAERFQQPMFWGGEKKELLFQTEPGTIAGFVHAQDGWRKIEDIHLPLAHPLRESVYGASDGQHILTTYMDTTTPPELILYERGWKDVRVFADLNSKFDDRSIAPAETVHWKTSTGYDISGLLLKPVGYIKGRRYPLVIQTKEDVGTFLCDSGIEHFPSFAPQPMANAGLMYLIRTIPDNFSAADQQHSYPVGYPGGVAEAAFYMDVFDRAVDVLDERGLIDRNKVGIIGYSKTGWYTQFALAHGRTRYAAATTADNFAATLAEYWQGLNKDVGSMNWLDNMYGGPPSGKTLKNWLDYSISFNLDKFHTPLLMEKMGYGEKNPFASDTTYFEIFAELNHLGKPVELYYYPDEQHEPNDPQARLATLQRNLDWYRFWLQGYERPHPEDPNQYNRWEHLRALQDADDRAAGQSQAGAAKPK